MNNLYLKYKNEIINKMIDKFKYSSIMQVPKIVKITINIGVGKSISNKKLLDNAFNDLKLISGQKPILTKAKKSISGFKIRKGYPIGCKVTIRKTRMWDFIERLIYISIPRIRDFRGLSLKSFDNQGNYNIGIKEQIIFPEIYYDKIDCIRGMNISITIINVKNNNESLTLLKLLNFPFKD